VESTREFLLVLNTVPQLSRLSAGEHPKKWKNAGKSPVHHGFIAASSTSAQSGNNPKAHELENG
jgi:hypothetical protein